MFRQLVWLVLIISLSACVVEKQRAVTVDLQKAAALNAEIALVYLNQGQITLAEEKLLLARQQAPNSITVLLALADYQQQVGQIKQAKHTYRKLLILAPKNPMVLNNYAVFLCRQKHYIAALRYFQQLALSTDLEIAKRARLNAKNCKTVFVPR